MNSTSSIITDHQIPVFSILFPFDYHRERLESEEKLAETENNGLKFESPLWMSFEFTLNTYWYWWPMTQEAQTHHLDAPPGEVLVSYSSTAHPVVDVEFK